MQILNNYCAMIPMNRREEAEQIMHRKDSINGKG